MINELTEAIQLPNFFISKKTELRQYELSGHKDVCFPSRESHKTLYNCCAYIVNKGTRKRHNPKCNSATKGFTTYSDITR